MRSGAHRDPRRQSNPRAATLETGAEGYRPTQTYTAVRAWSAEGARVGLVTCMDCGAALLIDPSDEGFNVIEQHDRWHRSLEAMHGWANTPDGQVEVTVRRQR